MTPEQLMDTGEVAALLGITPETLRVSRSAPKRYPGLADLPDPLRQVSGRPVWSRAVVEAWVAGRG